VKVVPSFDGQFISNGVAQYNRLSQVTRESKTVAAFRKHLRKEIEARNYNCQMAGADL